MPHIWISTAVNETVLTESLLSYFFIYIKPFTDEVQTALFKDPVRTAL